MRKSGTAVRERRHIREEDAIRSRLKEERRLKTWTDVKGYYDTCNLKSKLLSNWAESECYTESAQDMSALQEESSSLDERRQKLKGALEAEMKRFETEEKSYYMSEEKPGVNIEMKRREKEIAGRDAELMLYHSGSSKTPNQLTQQYLKATRKPVTGILPDAPSFNEMQRKKKLPKEKSVVPFAQHLEEQQEEEESFNYKEDIGELFEKIREFDTQQSELEDEELKNAELLSNVDTLFQAALTIEGNTYRPNPNVSHYEIWKKKSNNVINDLKKAISFLQAMKSCSSNFGAGDEFLETLENYEAILEEYLEYESCADRLKYLLKSSQEQPNKKWFPTEMLKYKNQEATRHEALSNIHSQFQSIVKMWSYKNVKKVSDLLVSKNEIMDKISRKREEKERPMKKIVEDVKTDLLNRNINGTYSEVTEKC